MLKANFYSYVLKFKKPGGTSRGVLTEKESFMIEVWDEANPEKKVTGECGILKGLSTDDRPDYQKQLQWACDQVNEPFEKWYEELRDWPSIQFGLEMALKEWKSEEGTYFDTPFSRGEEGIPINGLIWMGSKAEMLRQIEDKLKAGFKCLKMKIGALDFEDELEVLEHIRNRYSADRIELRVDANGAFTEDDAPEKLKELAAYDLHSIEQPIKQGQVRTMRDLCMDTPLPIALDEELIGVTRFTDKIKLLDDIQPQYVVLKPSFIGGWKGTQEWIDAAQSRGIGWWITSALESNIGLNAIAQFTATQNITMAQGLGTGGLFTNNIDRPLEIREGKLFYNPEK